MYPKSITSAMSRRFDINRTHFKIALIAIFWSFSALSPDTSYAQDIRAGAAYLKILPGTRQQNLAGSLTGSLNGTFSVYANPGATGFLRHWQFSASYTKWIADISNASLFYGRQFRFRTPLTEKLYLGLGLHRQGIDDFDATDPLGSNFVSASDMLLSLSLGLPIKGISRNLSIGTNIKYFRSELAQHNASTVVFDAGIIFRTSPRPFNFLFSEQIIFSAGAAVTQMGKPLTFIARETPLPKTFRAGVAFNLGKHDGLQLQLAADYRKVRDEDGRVGLGLEIINLFGRRSWGRLMTVRGGYIFDNKRDERLFNKFSLGLSFRLDDYIHTSRHAQKASRIFKNAALRLDGGFLNSKTFSNIYQGSVTYRPVGPEPFEFVKNDFMSYDVKTRPDSSYQVLCDTIPLTWKATNDPDLYDEVNYLMLIIKDDSTALDHYIQMAKRNDHDLHGYLKDDKASPNPIDATEIRLLHVPLSNERQLNYDLSIPCDAPGDYYWTVIAYDINRHFRVINADEGHIARFYVKPAPQFTIEIEKHPNQGSVDVKITNVDSFDIDRDFLLRISFLDSTQSKSLVYKATEELTVDKDFPQISDIRTQGKTMIDWGVYSPADSPMERKIIPGLPAGDSVKFQVKVNSTSPYVIAEIDSANVCCANVRNTLVLSDPQLNKTAVVAPFQPHVIFRKVGSFTLTRSARSELQRLAKAFKSPLLKDVCIKINGHTDEQGWQGRTHAESMKLNEELSLQRVTSVRDYLNSLGVDRTRIILQGYGQNKPRTPKVDSTFVHHKTQRDSLHRTNRRVEIYLIRTNCTHNVCSMTNLNNCAVDTLKTVNPGDQITYIFKVKNDSQFAARNVEIRDLLPEHVYPDSKGYLTNGNRYLFSETIPLIPPGTTKTIKFFATVNDSLPSALFKLANTATLHSPNDLDLSNNTSSDSIYVIGGQPPNIEPIVGNAPNLRPVVTFVSITGEPKVGQVLKIENVVIRDPEGDPLGKARLRWLRDGQPIEGAKSTTYQVHSRDAGKMIALAVTPLALQGTSPGQSVRSEAIGPIDTTVTVDTLKNGDITGTPQANRVRILGIPKINKILFGCYEYSDHENDKEGTSLFQWLRDDGKVLKIGATTYTPSYRDSVLQRKIIFEVTPVAKTGVQTGLTRRSDEFGPIKRRPGWNGQHQDCKEP